MGEGRCAGSPRRGVGEAKSAWCSYGAIFFNVIIHLPPPPTQPTSLSVSGHRPSEKTGRYVLGGDPRPRAGAERNCCSIDHSAGPQILQDRCGSGTPASLGGTSRSVNGVVDRWIATHHALLVSVGTALSFFDHGLRIFPVLRLREADRHRCRHCVCCVAGRDTG